MSFLSWARTNDVEVYAEAQKAGKLKKGTPRIESFRWSELNSQMNRLITEVAHLTHVTQVKGTKARKKKFKAPKLGWPRTAVEGLKDRSRAAKSEAQKRFMAMFQPQPQAEWEAEMAEHRAALEADPTALSPPQQRALAEAAARDQDTATS